MVKLNKIMVPIDFSDDARTAVEYAEELALRFHAELHLFHAVEPLTMIVPSPGVPMPEQLMHDVEKESTDQLEKLQFEGQFPVVRAVRRGVAFQEICQYATDNDIDMIVMGTHGRTGIAHALIGSVAERVVRKAPCAVLAVRPNSAG